MSKAGKMVSRKQSSAELYINETHKLSNSDSLPNGDVSTTNDRRSKARLKKNYSLQDNLKNSSGSTNSTNNSSSGNCEELGTINELDLAACNCGEHSGVPRLNHVYDLDIDYLYNCLFGYNEFHIAFAQMRRITGLNLLFLILSNHNGAKLKKKSGHNS
jgi:hypothetical protein